MMQRWGYDIRYREHPGGGHGGLGELETLVPWMLEHRRVRAPREVRVRAPGLKGAEAHWVRVEQVEDPFRFVQVRARLLNDRTLIVDSDNALQIRLSPGHGMLDAKADPAVVWNGEALEKVKHREGEIVLTAAGCEARQEVMKKPALAGLIGDVKTTPFMIVVGTRSEDPLARRFLTLRAEGERDDWQDWQHWMPRYKRDIDVTEEDMAAYSLILYGGPEENAVTAALIPDLPLEITPDAVSVDGVRFEARDAAVGLVCPNPRNPNRYVLVKAATSALGLYHLNQIPNEYDFAIVDGRAPAEGETGEVWVAAGRFDRNWRLDERYVVRGDEEARSRATVTGVPVDGQ